MKEKMEDLTDMEKEEEEFQGAEATLETLTMVMIKVMVDLVIRIEVDTMTIIKRTLTSAIRTHIKVKEAIIKVIINIICNTCNMETNTVHKHINSRC